jgi:hypothetical protein
MTPNGCKFGEIRPYLHLSGAADENYIRLEALLRDQEERCREAADDMGIVMSISLVTPPMPGSQGLPGLSSGARSGATSVDGDADDDARKRGKSSARHAGSELPPSGEGRMARCRDLGAAGMGGTPASLETYLRRQAGIWKEEANRQGPSYRRCELDALAVEFERRAVVAEAGISSGVLMPAANRHAASPVSLSGRRQQVRPLKARPEII